MLEPLLRDSGMGTFGPGRRMNVYDATFFSNNLKESVSSAHVIIHMLRSLARFESVIDVGCGTGAWLSVFAETGTSNYLGLDGPWAERAGLMIPSARFVAADLTRPPVIPRRFDLALSVEVAEHLPSNFAESFVGWLTTLAPVIAFSAAIPGQGGTDHLNEQWPDYWAAKFHSRGYVCIDCIRMRAWSNPAVQWWYAQNLLLYVDRAHLDEQPALKALAARPEPQLPARLVHPACFELVRDRPLALGMIVREGYGAVRRAVAARLRGRHG